MDYSQIIYEVADNVATITLNRPEQLNAFTGVMMNELIDAIDRTDADDDVRAVIGVGLIDRVDQLVHHRARERVELRRAVQRDGGDVVGDLVDDLAVVHRRNVAGSWAGD